MCFHDCSQESSLLEFILHASTVLEDLGLIGNGYISKGNNFAMEIYASLLNGGYTYRKNSLSLLKPAAYFWMVSNTREVISCLEKLSPFAKWRQNLSGVSSHLKKLDTLGRFSAIFYKGDNFCDFLFASLHINPLLRRGLL